MKTVIKSIAVFTTSHNDYDKPTVRIQTKSNKIIEYTFDTVKLAQQYVYDITS